VIVFSAPQNVGTSLQYTWGGASVLRRMDILNATGDAFHAGCRFTI